MSIESFPRRGRNPNDYMNQPPPPDPPSIVELIERVTHIEKQMGVLEKSVDSLKGLVDGFKDSLRAMQWSLGIILTVGLVFIGWMLNGMSGQIGGMNVRLDRFLERQAETASAANARFDRLLEQRAVQPPNPIVIQVPVVTPTGAVPPQTTAPP